MLFNFGFELAKEADHLIMDILEYLGNDELLL